MTEKKKKKAVLNVSGYIDVICREIKITENGEEVVNVTEHKIKTIACPRKMRRQCRKTLPFKESDKKRIRIN